MGENVGCGKDHTLFAKANGVVRFAEGPPQPKFVAPRRLKRHLCASSVDGAFLFVLNSSGWPGFGL